MRGHDDLPTPEEWAKIKAEWMHDHGMRHMDDCGVKYEDQAERTLDHDARNAMSDVRADVFDGLMSRLEAFGDEFARLARTKQQKALAEAFGELVGDVHASITYIAETSRQHGPPATGPPHPWPSEIAEADRLKQVGQEHGYGHDAGHSM